MSIIFTLFRHEPVFVTIPEGDCLFREGDVSEEAMFVLIAGRANILLGDRLVEKAVAGTIVGEMGLIHPNEHRSATVQATTDCQFAKIDAKRFDFLVAEAPYFAIEMMRVLTDRLRRTDAMLRKAEN